MLILDTDVLIDIQHGIPSALTWYAGLKELPHVPGLVVMELIQGAKNAKQVHDVLRLTAPLPVVWATSSDGERALADFAKLHLSHGLGPLDAMIASIAVGLSADLCTFNDKHYRAVSGLSILRPYTRP